MRRFVVGSLEFVVVGKILTYSPTRSARFYQAFAAGCIGWISVLGAYLVLSFAPFSKLGDWTQSWDVGAAVSLGAFGLILFIAGQIYYRRSCRGYSLDKLTHELSRDNKVVKDLTFSAGIVVTRWSGSMETTPAWSVGSREGGKDRGLPLLTFESESDADQVAQEVSSFLGLPILT
jgi:hypothetical protein